MYWVYYINTVTSVITPNKKTFQTNQNDYETKFLHEHKNWEFTSTSIDNSFSSIGGYLALFLRLNRYEGRYRRIDEYVKIKQTTSVSFPR